jgi:glycosyltransferase involved in cell wall biosynthesis
VTPRVSVVVPSYNNAHFIEATLDSILAQTFTDFELLVADHSSTDGTWELLQRYAADPRVRLMQTRSGGGAAANWTRVTNEAKGELIKLVCGDDLVYPSLLAEQVAALDAHRDVVLVSCRRDLIDAHGRVVIRNRGLAGLPGRVDGHAAARRTIVAGANIFGEPACVLMRRETLELAGGWHADQPYVIDESTYVNVLMHGDFYGINKSLAGFRLSASQWSVHLAQEQSAQVTAFHRAFADAHPGLLSRLDLLRGDNLARATAYLRRLTYAWVGRRMHANWHDERIAGTGERTPIG